MVQVHYSTPVPALKFTPIANRQLIELEARADMKGKCNKVKKALGQMEADLRHPGLKSHKYDSHGGIDGGPLFEVYVENNTPSAWRIFWSYGPGEDEATIISIEPHR